MRRDCFANGGVRCRALEIVLCEHGKGDCPFYKSKEEQEQAQAKVNERNTARGVRPPDKPQQKSTETQTAYRERLRNNGFKDRLRELMGCKSSQQMVEITGYSAAQWSKWLNGESIPRPQTTAKLADCFYVTKEWLEDGAE